MCSALNKNRSNIKGKFVLSEILATSKKDTFEIFLNIMHYSNRAVSADNSNSWKLEECI